MNAFRHDFGQPSTPASLWVEATIAGAWAAWYTAAAGVGLSLLASQQSGSSAASCWSRRSWYRPPVETASFLTAWLPGLRASETAFDWWRVGTAVPSVWPTSDSRSLEMMRFWLTTMVALSMPMMSRMLATSPSPAQQWMQLAFAWPLAAPRTEVPAPFAFYRSDSGHATAQLMVPEMVAAAAMWPAFAFPFWPRV